jgi:outer membrane protein assembly factor BamB
MHGLENFDHKSADLSEATTVPNQRQTGERKISIIVFVPASSPHLTCIDKAQRYMKIFTPSTAIGLVILAINALNSSIVIAENWPGWRGPRGDGSAIDSQAPTEWDGTKGAGIAWKIPLPGYGHSSPIVWNDRILVTGCIDETQERYLLCLDAKDGKEIWKSTVVQSNLETKHKLNSYASGTPATDGKTIYVSFLETDGRETLAKKTDKPKMMTPGAMVVAAFDMGGKPLWQTRPTEFSSVHGFCTSPVIFENLLIVNGDHDGESSILGLNRETGETVWKFPRVHQTRSYCTPLIREAAGKTQMVLSGSKQVVSLNPRTGKEYWHVEGPTEQFVASMVFDGEKFYLTAGFPDYFVMAVKPDGSGDVTKSHVAWNSTEAKCYVPSPVLAGKHLFVADDRGTMNCFDTESGKRLWLDRLSGHYSASLLNVNGLVYCTADDGVVRVLRPGPSLDIVSTNPLGESSFASAAVSNGRIYIRGEQHLFAIGLK